MTTQITQSVIAKNLNCTSNEAFSGLISLRTTGNSTAVRIPITTLEGRLTGTNVNFNNGTTYEDYKMRRKAEVLKYRHGTNAPGIDISNKQNYRNIIKNGGSFSSSRLKKLMEENSGNIPDKCLQMNRVWTVSTPSQSGVRDYNTPGYYLDPYVPYYPSL
jgi:hypothetical protein